MKRLVSSLATLLVRRRAPVVASVLFVTAALAACIPWLRTDPSPEKLVASRDGQAATAAELRESFGDSDRVVVLLVRAADVLRPTPLGYLHLLSRHFVGDAGIARVDSVTVTPLARRAPPVPSTLTLDDLAGEDLDGDEDDRPPLSIEVQDALGALAAAEPQRYPQGVLSLFGQLDGVESGPLVEGDAVSADDAARVREALEDAPLLEGRLISADRRVAAVMLQLAGVDHDARDAEVDRIERWIGTHPPPAGVRVDAGGLPVLRRALSQGIAADQRVLLPITMLVCAVLLLAGLRWLGGVALSLATVGIAAAMVVGGMAAVGEPMNVLNEIVPPLLIIIGVSDAIHLVSRYREELRGNDDRFRAARRTVRSMAVACFFTSITTAVGLASLLVSETEMLREFGLLAAVGVMLAYVVTIAFLPAALTYLPKPEPLAARGDWLERGIARLTRVCLRRRGPVLAASGALMGLALVAGAGVRVDTRLLDPFDDDAPAVVTTHLMEDELSGTRPLEVLLHSDDPARFRDPHVLAALDRTADWAARQPIALGVTSATDVLHEGWRVLDDDPSLRHAGFVSPRQVDALETLMTESDPSPLRAYLREDGRVLRMQVMLADAGAQASQRFIEGLRSRLEAGLPSDVDIAMTGEAYIGSLALESVVDDLTGSLAVAVVIIFAMLAFLFRSTRLAMVSIPVSLTPLIATAAWMRLRGISLDVATAIIFSIALGLAVDGTIHVLARFREERARRRSVDAAILAAARGTGRAIVVSCATLSVGFGVLAASELVPVRQFGELIAVSVASCALATLVILPPLVSLVVREPQPVRADSVLKAVDTST